MGEFSPIHWLIVLAIIVLLFGGKKIPEVMRGLGEGIRSFKDGMSGPHTSTPASNPPANPPATTPAQPAPSATEEKK
jgi:sec-independent protein translocase protein TatA